MATDKQVISFLEAEVETMQKQLDAANQRVALEKAAATEYSKLCGLAYEESDARLKRAEAAERKLARRLAENNQWWEKRFEYFHRWAKTLPEPHITEFFDIAANGNVAEWRERYKEIKAQIEQPGAKGVNNPETDN
jgi:hypothetical protein